MNPRKLLVFISPVLFVLSFAVTAEASTISLTPSSLGMMGGVCAGNNEPDCVYTAFGLVDNGTLVLYYKGDKGNPDEGTFAASYDTVFANTSTNPSDATITWVVSSPSIICPSCFLVIKGGIGNPPPYFFYNLSTWNGTDTIELTGFWPNGGAISHVSIWGAETSELQPVPEPGTLLLLGAGLVLVARRMRARPVA